MWSEHVNERKGRTKVFFHGKREHDDGLRMGCCREVSEKQVQRAAAFAAMQGKDIRISIYGCYSGLPCPKCQREAGEGLWVTTNEPPRPLEELFPSTPQPGQDPSEPEAGSLDQPSESTTPKKKRKISRKARRKLQPYGS